MRTSAVRGGWPLPCWAVAVSLVVLPGAAAATCGQAPSLGARAGAERSLWQERDAQGATLVRESGTLRAVGLDVTGRCRMVDWSAQWTLARGDRGYDGQTTTQVPFQTVSRLQAQHLAAQAWLPVRSGWAVGTQVAYRHIERDIAGQGNVMGYPERFGYWQAALGGRYQAALGAQLRLTASVWLGGGPGGRVHLDLPRADPATLRLGGSRLLALDLQLDGGEGADRPGWSWQAGMSYRHEQHRAGPSTTLMRNGVPVGAASQPKFVQHHLRGTAHATYRF